jgi:hypothetical protein
MLRRALLGATAASLLLPRRASAREREPVDVELILAVDSSYSISREELALQYAGYAEAFRHPELHRAVTRGAIGSIACSILAWASYGQQQVVVPWTLIDSADSATAFANRVATAERPMGASTSISGAIEFAIRHFEACPQEGLRRVLDISGDGANNHGPPVAAAREAALRAGIVLNGLPISGPVSGAWIADYYRSEVIGGAGSFLILAEGYASFAAAVRRKILREIS